MNTIKLALTESILKQYAVCEKVLQYFPQSIKTKAERLYATANKLVNVIL